MIHPDGETNGPIILYKKIKNVYKFSLGELEHIYIVKPKIKFITIIIF